MRPPDELPGTLNPITGMRVLLDVLRRGDAHHTASPLGTVSGDVALTLEPLDR